MSYEKIKYYYESGLWSLPMVRTAVKKGVITAEEYEEITQEKHPV